MGNYKEMEVCEDILSIFAEAQHYADSTCNDDYFNRRLNETTGQRQLGDVNFKELYAY